MRTKEINAGPHDGRGSDMPEPRQVQPTGRLSVAERAARGKAVRAEVPRSSHAPWEPPQDRPDPVDLLEAQATTRVAELVPIRYGRMLVSPFTFFRGAALIMASDLAGTHRTDLRTQLCGDAHLSNFGVFAAPDRRLVFSINDFDETLPGPFEWDVKRLVASFAVAGRDRGFDLLEREAVNLTVTRSYRESISQFALMRTLDLWYARLDVDELRTQWSAAVSKAELKAFERNTAKARAKDGLRALTKLTHLVDGQPRILADPPLVVPIDDLMSPEQSDELNEAIHTILRSYRRTLAGDRRHLLERFHYVHAARKVVGVGSVGTRAWIALMVGKDEGDPLFLQLKEAGPSVLEAFLGGSGFATHGQRVVEGQRLMQAASDVTLGWFRVKGADDMTRDFYVRQLWDGKGSALLESMTQRGFTAYARACGWTLARAHARAGDAVAIASYLGAGDTFDQALASFAESYATQNERDYAALRQAVVSGRVTAMAGL